DRASSRGGRGGLWRPGAAVPPLGLIAGRAEPDRLARARGRARHRVERREARRAWLGRPRGAIPCGHVTVAAGRHAERHHGTHHHCREHTATPCRVQAAPFDPSRAPPPGPHLNPTASPSPTEPRGAPVRPLRVPLLAVPGSGVRWIFQRVPFHASASTTVAV